MRAWTLLLMLAGGVVASDVPWTRVLPSPSVELRDPRGMSVTPDGVIYIADTGHHRVIAVDSSGNVLVETGGLGSAHGQFRWPTGVVADRGNSVWVLDWGNRRIEKFTRLLEYQGTLEIRERGEDHPRQIEALALSPQGDLFVYDRDGGRLLRYDPLFTLQAESGAGRGAEFISNVGSLALVPRRGLFRWERGTSEIRRMDPLLNPVTGYAMRVPREEIVLTDADSCLIVAWPEGVLRSCSDNMPPDTLLDQRSLAAIQPLRIGAACAVSGVLYLLDRGSGSMYRIGLNSK